MAHAKRITILDVAEESGVSFQTVSRVINDRPHVAPSTRERVLAAVSKLGYQPNKAARSLITNRVGMLGLLGFGVEHYVPAKVIDNFEREAKSRGYALSIHSIERFANDALERGVREMLALPLDGLAIFAPIVDLDEKRVVRACGGSPFVLIDTHPGTETPSVIIDQVRGAQLAADYLTGKGHRTIAQIHGPFLGLDGKLRHDAFAEALLAQGLEVAAHAEGDWSAQGGYGAMQEILAAACPSAVFVHSDQMALGAFRAAREAGLRIPEDLSFVGFDDIPEAAFFDPPLTTVVQDFGALGFQSVDLLVSLLSDAPPKAHQRVIVPTLVERCSVAQR